MVFLKRLLPTALTMTVAGFTLLLFFLPAWVVDQRSAILYIRAYWIELAVVIAAFAMLLGLLNLFSVHWERIRQRQRRWFFSFISISAAVAVVILSVLEQGVAKPGMMAVYTFVLYPLQSSFTALLAFLLAFAAYRALRLRRGLGAWLFLVAASLVLAAQAAPAIPGLLAVKDWLVNVWATAGLRGVLLGIALGTAATMTRVLLGFDRPASE